MAEVPRWRLAGDWFDVCRCRVPCGCTFAQAPDDGQCDGILAWHVREGNYGDVPLDGLSVVAVGSSSGEAARRLGRSWKATDNAVQRAKRELSGLENAEAA
jgi:hypothetical protein